MKNVVEFLRELTEKFPPPNNNNHSICLGKDLNKELIVTIATQNGFQQIYLNQNDLEKDPKKLVADIIKLFLIDYIKESISPEEQKILNKIILK